MKDRGIKGRDREEHSPKVFSKPRQITIKVSKHAVILESVGTMLPTKTHVNVDITVLI